MNKKGNNLFAKKDFKEILHKALSDQATSIIEAVNFGFEKAKEDRQEIKNKLSSLERRVIYIEDVITKHTKQIKSINATLARYSRILAQHSKELKEIKAGVKELKARKEPLIERVNLLEKRIALLEAKVV